MVIIKSFLALVLILSIYECSLSFAKYKVNSDDELVNIEIQRISYQDIMGNVNESNILKVKIGEKFTIGDGFELESNPSTGYKWVPAFDKNKINLLSHKFEPSNNNLLGSPGKEIFVFEAINPGVTNLTLSYQKEWEDNSQIEKKNIQIIIN